MEKIIAALTGLFLLLSSTAFAKTTVISSLGEAPLIGEIRSTQELTNDVFKQTPRLAKAAAQLGMTSEQFDEFTTDVATNENVRWVTVPRHLEAMSWQSNGRVHVIRDVQIPANSRGWAVYLKDGATVYMPARCGNLSILHGPAKRIAAVKAASAPAPLPPVAAPLPEEAPAPVAAAPAPAEFPTPTPLSAIPPPPPVHHSFLAALAPLLLVPLAFAGASHGSAAGFLPRIAGPFPSIGGPAIAPVIPVIGGGSPPGGGGGACCGCGCD